MEKVEFVNLTPHTLNIHSNGNVTVIKPSNIIARVSTQYKKVDTMGGVEIFQCVYGEVEGLPAPKDGVVFVVSGLVKTTLLHRQDVMSPGELIRDESGKPIGCNGLRR